MTEATIKKLTVLADAAKYDVSCSSSGTSRRNKGGLGNASQWGVCHSFTEDGRCVSLLKVLATNHCIYDCAYCINRKSNDIPRASLSVKELVSITLEFYRRNYIEGLFLSSAVVKSPDHTMEQLVRTAQELRKTHKFNGYIHMKSIPGASRELVHLAGLFADRLSVNIEIPSEKALTRLAPEKNHVSVYTPMNYIHQGIAEYQDARKKFKYAPKFTPAGQSTQMIVGASEEKDCEILRLASLLYKGPALKRVYYSGFIPVNSHDIRLPSIASPPFVREHRLYQADWLMRYYHFQADEIASQDFPELAHDIDPKLAWALRNPHFFPIDVNTADYLLVLRVPGIGKESARRIIASRRHGRLAEEHLKKIGVVMKRAKYFLDLPKNHQGTIQEKGPDHVRSLLAKKTIKKPTSYQLSLFSE